MPGLHLGPKGGMDDVESFKVLLVFVLEHVVDFPHPRHRRVVIALGQRVEVQDDVIASDQRIQQRYQIKQRLWQRNNSAKRSQSEANEFYFVQIDFVETEPFADEDNDRPAEFVDAALVQTADAGDFGQIFRFGTTQ